MLKSIIKSFLMLGLVVSPVFADLYEDEYEINAFNQYGDSYNYPEPPSAEAFLATKASIPSVPSGYFGLNFGTGYAFMKPEIEIVYSGSVVTEGVDQGNVEGDENSMYFEGGAFAGYGVNINNFYVGGEFGLAYNFLDEKLKGVAKNIKHSNNKPMDHYLEMSVKRQLVATLDFIPGYFSKSRRVLYYGRLGVGASFVKLKLTDTAIDPKGAEPTETMSTIAERVRFNYRAGLGIEYFVSKSFGLRIEYVYSLFRSKDGHKVSRFVDIGQNDRYNYSYGIGGAGIHQLGLSISFHP